MLGFQNYKLLKVFKIRNSTKKQPYVGTCAEDDLLLSD